MQCKTEEMWRERAVEQDSSDSSPHASPWLIGMRHREAPGRGTALGDGWRSAVAAGTLRLMIAAMLPLGPGCKPRAEGRAGASQASASAVATSTTILPFRLKRHLDEKVVHCHGVLMIRCGHRTSTLIRAVVASSPQVPALPFCPRHSALMPIAA
jgi:hypothetical protein